MDRENLEDVEIQQDLLQIDTAEFGKRLKKELRRIGASLGEKHPEDTALSASGTLTLKFDAPPDREQKPRICCICFRSDEGAVLCLGTCCHDPRDNQ
jgi:hypothetical protein